ncbi:MAG: YafY family transcriptional regulator [Spirochaetes bacterium]|nr:YafY family transcriptional regulator [Spirochaetota bacterium]MBU1079016.1 YafY family transcriptional regulator [Spirochaetota bacterium]
MKNERLLAMLDCLLNEGRTTSEALSRRFEVSRRTIYRDMDSLCLAGVPIVAEAGIGGGYSIDPAYRIDRSFLSKDELGDLTGLLKGLSEALKDKNLERSLSKLSSLGPGAGGDAASGGPSLPPPLLAALSPWAAQGPDPLAVIALRRAIADRRVASFLYVDGGGSPSRRSVEPFTLVLWGAAWYLHAYCRLRSGWRLFKLARMSSIRTEPERYDPAARMPAPDPLSEWGETTIRVILSAEPSLRLAVSEALPEAAVSLRDDGGAIFSFQYPDGSWLRRFILGFGPGLAVIEPRSLRDDIRKAALAIADMNCQRG